MLTPEDVAYQIGFIAFGRDVYYNNYTDPRLSSFWMAGFNARGALALINTTNNTNQAELEKIHELTTRS